MRTDDGRQDQLGKPPELAMPVAAYFNIFRVSHTPNEFFLEFMQGQVVEGKLTGQMVARLITNPAHMEKVLQAIQTNIANYKATFGDIPDPTTRGGLVVNPVERLPIKPINLHGLLRPDPPHGSG